MKKIFTPMLSLILMTLILIFSVFTTGAYSYTTSSEYPFFEFAVESGANNEDVYGVVLKSDADLEEDGIVIPEDIVIPEYANNHLVKYVGEKAFYKNTTVKSITLHEQITQIQSWGMRKCENLEKVYCPKSLAVIWKYALAYNPKLSSLLLRNTSVENFYECAFMNDTTLKYLSLPSTTKIISGKCFSKTALETMIIPDGTTTIDYSAFADIDTLEAVYIPSSVTTMGDTIFKNSPNVTVYCEEGSTAQQYCIDNSVKYEVIEKSAFPSMKLGDTNNSGKVNINDVSSMQEELCGMDEEFIPDNCDVNGDCAFDINDVTYLQRHLARVSDLPY